MFFRKSADHTALSDTELIQKYKETSDLEVLGVLYNRYIHLVYGVCLKYLKQAEDAQDAVMQIFEKLVTDLQKHEVQNFRGWLHVNARNYCLMELRKKKTSGENQISSISDMEYQLGEHPVNEDSIDHDLESMKECMEELPEEQKKCIQLFYLDQKSYKEVAEIHGFELKKVKSYIQNGKRNIKQCMDRKNDEG